VPIEEEECIIIIIIIIIITIIIIIIIMSSLAKFHTAVKKVKESRYRPGVPQRVPGVLGSQIFMTLGT
jgi:uncharacterized alpha/beta hydrolase family protein